MKQLFVPTLAALVAGVVTFAYVSTQKEKETTNLLQAQEMAWKKDKADLEAALAEARKRAPIIRTVISEGETEAGASVLNAEEILEKLKKIPASNRDPKSMRRVIYHLEQLVDLGPAAVPAIHAYLDRFEDIDYLAPLQEEQGEDRSGRGRDQNGRPDRNFRGGRNEVRLTFSTPPSLRIGLIDVLQSIGGEEAEAALAAVLDNTGRAVELAYAAKAINEMAPSKYGPNAVEAAKDLLVNPPAIAGADQLDRNAKDYLYYVLEMFGDTSFASTAQTMLVTAEGRIDRQALSYLNTTLKEQAMPAIYSAYSDPRITNQWEKATLMNLALNYAGQNQQANEMINGVISDENLPSQVRAMTVFGLGRGDSPAETLQARLPLIEALKGSTQDERIQRSLDITQQTIEDRLSGKEPDPNLMRGFFRDRRGFRSEDEGRAP